MEYYRKFMDSFWNEDVWLPPNTTWADLTPDPSKTVVYTDHRHLIFPLPMALIMILIRYLLEKYWFMPIGKSLGVKSIKLKNAPDNPILEKAYLQIKKWNHKQIQGLAKQTDMTDRQVERWLRLRRAMNKPTDLVKFSENAWKFAYYVFSLVLGISVLWDKPWLWDINECWTGFPHQSLTNDIWWYYMISMSFYWSLCISQFFDVKRKDFWQMFIHHIATILLIWFSWVVNVYRVGSLVLIVHDSADVFMELAKMAKYTIYQSAADIIFIIFIIMWLVTRVGLYPFWIIRNTAIDAANYVPMFPAYYIFNSLLIILLVLHMYWTYLILNMAYDSVKAGHMEKDIRSSSDDISE